MSRFRVPTWLRIFASGTLLVLCMLFVRPQELVAGLAGIRLPYFILALGLNAFGTIVLRAWISHLTTSASGMKLPFAHLLRINFVARFYSLTLPRGASAAIRWQSYRSGGDGASSAALVIFESVVTVATLFISAGLLLGYEIRNGSSDLNYLLAVVVAGAILSVLAIVPFFSSTVATLIKKYSYFIFPQAGRLGVAVTRLLDAVSVYHHIGANKALIWVASTVGYVFFILSAWVLAIGMNLDLSIVAIAWIRSITLLVALIPITIAGIGLRETTLVALFSSYNVAPSFAFAYAVASFAIQVVLGIIGAGFEIERVLRGRTLRSPHY